MIRSKLQDVRLAYLHKPAPASAYLSNDAVYPHRPCIVQLGEYARVHVDLSKGANSKHVLDKVLAHVVAEPEEHGQPIFWRRREIQRLNQNMFEIRGEIELSSLFIVIPQSAKLD